MNRITRCDYVPKTPFLAHQQQEFLLCRDEESWAHLSEQGTGKTKVGIDELAWLYANNKIDAAAIVAPNGVHINWVTDELPKHLPDYVNARIAWWEASPRKEQRLALESLWSPKHQGLRILAMNVEALSTKRGRDYLRKFAHTFRVYCGVDESTVIKTPGAARTKALINMRQLFKYRRIFTGTPATESPLDFYAQFKFLDPTILGFTSFISFKHHYAVWETEYNAKTGRKYETLVEYANLGELQRRIQQHSFRVLRKDCLDLPEQIYQKRYVPLSKEQARVYNELRDKYVAELNGTTLSAPLALTRLLRLQQIIGNYFPSEDPETAGTPISKVNPRLEALLDVLANCEGKAIIWARFRKQVEEITAALNAIQPGSAVAYYGGVEKTQREANKQAFNKDPSVRWFVANQQTGGYGLTLVAAATVVYYSNDYSLEKRLQSEDRAHRIGQTKNVLYVDLVTPNTVDEKIINSLRLKQEISATVLGDKLKEWL